MATELHSPADTTAQLDRMLSQYLLAHGGKVPPRAWPPWRAHGRRPAAQDQASVATADDVQPPSRASVVDFYGNRPFD
jgi:hypothetical protein